MERVRFTYKNKHGIYSLIEKSNFNNITDSVVKDFFIQVLGYFEDNATDKEWKKVMIRYEIPSGGKTNTDIFKETLLTIPINEQIYKGELK